MLALVAGRGALPDYVAAACPGALICALAGQRPDNLAPDLEIRLETLGTFLTDLSGRGVTEVCFCGAIDRPGFDPAALDAATRPLVPVLQRALAAGDDAALRAVIELFEAHDLAVRAAHEMAPNLVLPAGTPTAVKPTARHEADAEAGACVLAEMGAADLGQACLIRAGTELAREDARGTDALLADWAGSADGALLFKAPKPGQDRRADLPAIGPATVQGAIRARLEGIVIEAGGVFVLEREEVIAGLDAAGLFLWVRAS